MRCSRGDRPSHLAAWTALSPCTSRSPRIDCCVFRINHFKGQIFGSPRRIPLDIPEAMLSADNFVQDLSEFDDAMIGEDLHRRDIRKLVGIRDWDGRELYLCDFLDTLRKERFA